jgi:hypothetical protein
MEKEKGLQVLVQQQRVWAQQWLVPEQEPPV